MGWHSYEFRSNPSILSREKKSKLKLSAKFFRIFSILKFSGSGDLFNRPGYSHILHFILKRRKWAFQISLCQFCSSIRTGARADGSADTGSAQPDDHAKVVTLILICDLDRLTWRTHVAQIVCRVLGQHHIQRSAKSKHFYYLKKNQEFKISTFIDCLTLNLTLTFRSNVKIDSRFWKPICEL